MTSLRHARRAGFSLLEATIALTVLSAIVLSIGLTGQKATEAMDESTHSGQVVQRLHRALDQVVEPMREAELAGLVGLGVGSDTITYRTPVGYAGAIQWGPDVLVALELDPGELDNGVDDDGDGLIDERQLVRTLAPGTADERRVVLLREVAELLEGETANGLDDNGNLLVDEAGFSVDVQGAVLTVRLTLESVGPSGLLVRKTAQTSVEVRN